MTQYMHCIYGACKARYERKPLNYFTSSITLMDAKIDSLINIAPSDKNLADHCGNREWSSGTSLRRNVSTRHFVSLILN